jgi:hypothetical protein
VLWVGQSLATVEELRTQLMQARKRDLHLPLHAGRAQDAAVVRALSGVREQSRLAYPGLATQDQRATLPRARICQDRIEPRTFGCATGQSGRRVPK